MASVKFDTVVWEHLELICGQCLAIDGEMILLNATLKMKHIHERAGSDLTWYI
jgi:hypothetical protein